MKLLVNDSGGKRNHTSFKASQLKNEQDLPLLTIYVWGVSDKKELCFCQLTMDIQPPTL